MTCQLRTKLCSLLGVEVAIFQAPIGGATCPELVAAVSNAGGVGVLSATWRTAAETASAIRDIKKLTDRPFGVNYVLRWDPREGLDVCLERGVPFIWLSWGVQPDLVSSLRRKGAVVAVTVASARQAEEAVAAGADVLVAQGWEAGGHLQGDVGLFALIPEVVQRAGGTPVVGAGGIVDGRGVAAALVLGAAGVAMGTRFVASVEAEAHAVYKEALVAATGDDTVVTTAFDVGWPSDPHRVVRNATYSNWLAEGRPGSGARPGEGDVLATAAGAPIARYHNDAPTRGMSGERLQDMALYAGQGVGRVRSVETAGAIVTGAWEQAHRCLSARCCGLAA